MCAYYHRCKSIYTKNVGLFLMCFQHLIIMDDFVSKVTDLFISKIFWAIYETSEGWCRMLFNRDSNVMTKGDDEPNSATSQYRSEWGADGVRDIDASIAAKAHWSIAWAATGIKIMPQVTSQPWYCYKECTGLLLIKPGGLILFDGLCAFPQISFFLVAFSCTWFFFGLFFFSTSPLWGTAIGLSW